MRQGRILLSLAIACMVGVGALGLAAQAGDGKSAGGPDFAKLLPHIPVVSPEESVGKFKVEPGFAVELVAAEPKIADPVDVAWDENGRMFVCELCNYPGVPKEGDRLGRIRVLTSSHRDGVYDQSSIFVDNLRWPSSAICWDGGIYVISNPDIWYFKDTHGNGVADVKKKVFTGLGGETYEIGNSLRWGPDDRIYLSGSYAGGKLRPVDASEEPAHGRDFRFDPRTNICETVSGGGEWGSSFNDWGDRFNCDATDLCFHTILPDADLRRNPYLAVPDTRENSAGMWAHVFPISAAEPWKRVRQEFWQKWVGTSSDFNPGRFPSNELAPQGFATSACGVTIYRGSAFPAEYLNDEFIGEPANNVVVHLKHTEDGVSIRSDRTSGNSSSEFLSSSDNRFRPVNFANGPDGCLYVMSMYREIIEDESAIPGDILNHYDLFSGRDLGRIYRVVPEGFASRAMPELEHASIAELTAALTSRESWVRETAQRLLYQKMDGSAGPALRDLCGAAPLPQTRIHALWTLAGLGALDAATLVRAMGDGDAHVREQAAIASETMSDSPEVAAGLLRLAEDDNARVRLHTAFALGLVHDERAIAALKTIARRDVANRWISVAVAAAVPERAGKLFSALCADEAFLKNDQAEMLLGLLAEVIGARHDSNEVAQLLADATGPALKNNRAGGAMPVLRQLSDGLAHGGSSLPAQLENPAVAAHKDALAGLFDEAAVQSLDASLEEEVRAQAVELLAFAPYANVQKKLLGLVDAKQPTRIQLEAVRAISAHNDEQVAADLLSNWKEFGPSVLPDVTKALLRRPERLGSLLDAIEKKQVRPSDLTPHQKGQLLNNPDSAISDRASKLFAKAETTDKVALIDRYRANVLKLPGDVERGKAAFASTCAVCHQPEHGTRPGPNLAILEDRSPGTLLIAILDPNREVKPSFINFLVVTKDGQTLSGVIDNETTNSITMRYSGGGEETVLRSNIKLMRSTGVSLMPEGLEGSLDYQKMADLLAYLRGMK